MAAGGALCMVGALGGVIGACGSFSSEPGPSDGDAGAAVLDSGVPSPDGASSDASTTFCGDHAGALFCDDFEGDDFATRWPLRELDLGSVGVIDGAGLGRAGKVVRFVQTKSGGPNDLYLRVRRQLGASLPVRIAYDLRMNDWPSVPGLSNMGAGNVDHGPLSSWLLIEGESKALYLLAFAGTDFYRPSGRPVGLRAPVDRWEHYEVVVIPDDPAHFEVWVGAPPVKVVEDTAKVPLPEGGALSPTFVEIGVERLNADRPMPAIEAYYDNVLVISPP
jgi:hypothetical protein